MDCTDSPEVGWIFLTKVDELTGLGNVDVACLPIVLVGPRLGLYDVELVAWEEQDLDAARALAEATAFGATVATSECVRATMLHCFPPVLRVSSRLRSASVRVP